MSNEAEKVREVGVWQMVEALTTALRQIEQERDQERARADKAEAALFHNGKHLIHECPPKGSGLTPCCERTVSAASAGVAGRGWLSCDVCEKPWAPYPKRDEALQCQQAAEAAFQRAVGAGYKNPDAAARQARTRKCASFGGFVHGDEGMGCWRCGESRQDHR